MKATPPMVFTLAMVILMLGSSSLRAQDKIKNGNFSGGLAEWKFEAFATPTQANPQGRIAPPVRNAAELVEETPGNKAVQITLDPKEYFHLSQRVQMRKSERIEVTVRAKASADYTASNPVLIVYLSGPDMFTRDPLHYRMFPLKAGGDWETFSAELQSVSKGNAVELVVKLLQSSGKVWIDDVAAKSTVALGR